MIRKGFTIIELMLVVAIIGILASFSIFSFKGAQAKARDVGRKNDIKQLQNLVENYANNNDGFYPADIIPFNENISENLCQYLGIANNCPQDPKEGQETCNGESNMECTYGYMTDNCGASGTACAQTYFLWATLENSNEGIYAVCSNGVALTDPDPAVILAACQ